MQGSEQHLRFLRYCLEENPSDDFPCQDVEWQGLYNFAVKQSIVGVVFRGVERLGKDAGVPKELLFKWFTESEQIRQRNCRLNTVAVKLSQRLARDGFHSCILKGQGNAIMYPDPSVRTPGDIDIWLEGSRREILEYVRSLVPNVYAQYHHVDFPVYIDVDVEIHFKPSRINNPLFNHRLQKFYKKHRSEQLNHVCLEFDEKGLVCTPTDDFNLIFQMSHIMKHFFEEGIGLRQLIDYYYLLRRGYTEQEIAEYRKIIRWLGMKKFASSVMWVEKMVLGLEDTYLIMEPYEKGGQLLLEEIMETGNFGLYDNRYSLYDKGMVERTIINFLKGLTLARVFPAEALSIPIARLENMFYKSVK